MSIFTRGADGFEHTEANRREVLLAAGGVAAATALAGHSVEKHHKLPAKANTLVVDSPDFTAFDVTSWSWGISNSGTTHIGGGAGAGKANVQDLSVSKYTDANSPRTFLAVATGKHYPKATLTWFDAKSRHTLTIVMEEVIFTSMSNGASVGSGPDTDNLTLNFARVTFSVDAASAGFDIAENTGA